MCGTTYMYVVRCQRVKVRLQEDKLECGVLELELELKQIKLHVLLYNKYSLRNQTLLLIVSV